MRRSLALALALLAAPAFAGSDLDRIRQLSPLAQLAPNDMMAVQGPGSPGARSIEVFDAVGDVLQNAPELRRARIGDNAQPTTCYDSASGSGVDLGFEACQFRSLWADEINGVPLPVSGGVGDVVGPASSTDHAIVRFDLTTGRLLQDSVAILSDTGSLTGLTDMTLVGSGTGTLKAAEWASSNSYYALGLAGTVAAGDYNLMSSPGDTHLYLNAPTGKEIRWRINNATVMAMSATALNPGAAGGLTLGSAGLGWGSHFFDSSSSANTLELVGPSIASNIQVVLPAAAGTLALTSDIHAPVTMSGTPDYITLSGQDIVRGQVDLASDVTGTLDSANIDQSLSVASVTLTGATNVLSDLLPTDLTYTLGSATRIWDEAWTKKLTSLGFQDPGTGGNLTFSLPVDFGAAINANGGFGGTSFKDEDDMASDSATAVASQQSVKAYASTHGPFEFMVGTIGNFGTTKNYLGTHGVSGQSTLLAPRLIRVGTARTITNFTVEISAVTAAGTGTTTFALENNTAGTSTTLTIAEGVGTTAAASGLTFAIAADDKVTFSIVTATGPMGNLSVRMTAWGYIN